MTLAMHLTGFGGMALAVLLSISPMKAVLEARRNGSLGGLDTRNWAFFFLCNLMWFLYSSETRDFWVYLSAIIGMCTWLWFCMTGIELLSLEEGELFPAISRATTLSTQHGEVELLNDFKHIHHMSVAYRKKALNSLRGTVAASLVFGTTVSFMLSPRSIPGMGFLDDLVHPQLRLSMFSLVAAASTLVCWVAPVLRMGSIIKRKDASSVFIPLTLAQMVNTSSWGVYGLLVSDWAITIPNFAGSVCGLLFIGLRLIYGGGGDQLVASTSAANTKHFNLAGGAGLCSETTSCTSSGCSSSRTFLSKRAISLHLMRPCNSNEKSNNNSNNNSNNSNNNNSSAVKLSKVVNAAPSALTNGPNSSTATATCLGLAAHEPSNSNSSLSPNPSNPKSSLKLKFNPGPARAFADAPIAASDASSSELERSGGIGDFDGIVPTSTAIAPSLMKVDLPDLSQRLRDCGLYEDDLKWQRDYRSWRCGSGHGAQGEVERLGSPQPQPHERVNRIEESVGNPTEEATDDRLSENV